jgi:hypothetical protein
MIYPSKPNVTQTAINSWLNKAWNTMKANRPAGGRGIRVRTSNDGFSLGVTPNSVPFMSYAGDYEPAAGYAVNEVVRVTTTASYSETVAGTVYTRWSYPGMYICVQTVPPEVDATPFQNADYYIYRYVQSLARETDVVYAPIYPEPTDQAKLYWHKIAFGANDINICVDGETVTSYVDSAISGSLSS